jgi:hypothetical protein
VLADMLVQHLADGEEGRERIAMRAPTIPIGNMSASFRETVKECTNWPILLLPLEEIAWRLFHEEQEVRIVEGRADEKAAVAIRSISAMSSRAFPPGSARKWPMRRAISSSIANFARAEIPDQSCQPEQLNRRDHSVAINLVHVIHRS